MASVFTKIIRGELPCYKIFEDELTISFLTLEPISPGHTLIVPKLEVNHWYETPEPDMIRLTLNAQRIAKAIQRATQCPRVGTITAGFEVQHYHLHMIPAWSIPDLDFKRAKKISESEMKLWQEKILAELN